MAQHRISARTWGQSWTCDRWGLIGPSHAPVVMAVVGRVRVRASNVSRETLTLGRGCADCCGARGGAESRELGTGTMPWLPGFT